MGICWHGEMWHWVMIPMCVTVGDYESKEIVCTWWPRRDLRGKVDMDITDQSGVDGDSL